MNYKVIGKYIGYILLIESILMIPALIISLAEGQTKAVIGFVVAILASFLTAMLLRFLCRNTNKIFYAKEGLVCVGLCWIALSLFGCIPFWLSGEIPHFVDASSAGGKPGTGCGATSAPHQRDGQDSLSFIYHTDDIKYCVFVVGRNASV